MEGNIRALADAIYRDKVRRARGLTAGERMDTAIELFEGAVGLMKDGIRAQFPGYGEREIEAAVRTRLSRIKQVNDHGLYTKPVPRLP